MSQNFNKYIIVLFSILVFWLGGVPLLFARAIPIICENISYNTSYNVTVAKPRLYLNIIPQAVIKSEEISIVSKSTKDKLSIKDLNIKIRILPLLSGRVHIDKIAFSDADMQVRLDYNTKLDKNFVNNLKSARIMCDCADFKEFKLKILSDNGEQSAEYNASDIFYKKSGRYLALRADSDIKIDNVMSKAIIDIFLPKNNDVNKSIIDVKISNFNISPLAEYLKNYLPSDLVNANGIIDIDVDKNHLDAAFKHFGIYKRDKNKSIIFPEELKISSGLNLSGKNIVFDRAVITSQNTSTTISGKISDYLTKKIPEYNLEVRIDNSKIEDYIDMLPAFKTEDIDTYKLKKYKFYGDILGNFTVKGHNLEPSINGSIFVNNGILTKPIPNAKGAVIKLDFKGKYLNYDVLVPAGLSEKVMVKGGVELYNVKYADMRVWSSDKVDLAIAEEKVVPIHEILNFVIGPVPIMDIKGVGNIDINIKGNRKSPHIWGKLNVNNVTTHFNEMPDLILSSADAVLTFDDENAVFNLKKGLINGQKVDINGTCNVAGKFDFDVKTEKQPLEALYKAILTSTIIDDMKMMLPPIDVVDGLVNLSLKVYGNIKDIYYVRFNKNFFTKGSLEFLGNKLGLGDVKIHSATGKINFENTNADIELSSFIGKSPLSFKALVKDKSADAAVQIPRLNVKDILPSNDKFTHEIADIIVNTDVKYKGRTDVFEFDKFDIDAQIIDVSKNNKLKLSNGQIILKNKKLQIKDIRGSFEDNKSSFNVNLQVDNNSPTPIFNGNINLKEFDLRTINLFSEYKIIPKDIRDIISKVRFNKGKLNLDAKISNNNVNTSTNLGGIEFVYTPINLPVKVINGSIYSRKNYLGLNKINMSMDGMPVLIDGGINNAYTKPDFNLYLNSKPNQDFIDKYINNNQIYPLKIKGDIVYWLKLKGTEDNFGVETEANLSKESSVYYLGATIGDIENSIILNLDMNVLRRNMLKIKEFSYDKLIDSQGKRQTRLNMLKANGGINIENNDLSFQDLRIKTNHPTDARIFNILFKKPNIKQGQFTSDLKFNGKLSNPHLTGVFHIVETNIPFLDTTMKNISFVFKDNTIDLTSKGEILGNDVKFKGTMRNKLTAPYYIEKAELYTKILDFNYITNRLKTVQASDENTFDSFNFDIKNAVIKNLKLYANKVHLRTFTAEDVEAVVSMTENKTFKINNFRSTLADGSINGNFAYNLLNYKTELDLKANNINANDITVALFDLKNQIYGDLTGNVKLSCDGADFNKCMETLNGNVMFDVKDGRMPKLGSLEYLLRAGNLIKGGLTGLSINSVIDILTPLKTGEFSEIYGTMSIKDGVSNDIEIATKGNNLSLFISGSYNFGKSDAEMDVLGLLSKKISTMFGPLGNVSLNTLFNVVPGVDLAKDSAILEKINKIPGIELNSKSFRKFIAEIKGNINGDNYVKSFEWIN